MRSGQESSLPWQAIRLPTFFLLSVPEPVVSFVLGSLALLGVLTGFFWRFVIPHFFWCLAFLSASSSSSSFTRTPWVSQPLIPKADRLEFPDARPGSAPGADI